MLAELKERNRQLKEDAVRVREQHRRSRKRDEPKAVESPTLVAALHEQVAALKKRNSQLKAETVRLREMYRGARSARPAHSMVEATGAGMARAPAATVSNDDLSPSAR